jgi:hypothetical protein
MTEMTEMTANMASTTNTSTKAPAKPVANLREAQKAQAQSRRNHPAGKQAPPKPAAKSAPAKAAAAKPATEAQKVTYAATARSGKTNTRVSTTPLSHAVDVKIAGRKGAQFAAGVIVAFYASLDAAQKVVDEINAGKVDSWSDAKIVAVKPVSAQVAS